MRIYLALILSIPVVLFMFRDIRELTICSSVIVGIPNFTLFGTLLPTNSVRAAGGPVFSGFSKVRLCLQFIICNFFKNKKVV